MQCFCGGTGLAPCRGILYGVSPRYPIGITFSSLPEKYHRLYVKDRYCRIGMQRHYTLLELDQL